MNLQIITQEATLKANMVGGTHLGRIHITHSALIIPFRHQKTQL